MGIILFISFIAIVAVGIANRDEAIESIRSGSINLKIGVFTFITGMIIHVSGTFIGFGELHILNQIVGICFLITFLCLIIGIYKFISLTSFSFNRKIGIFSLIAGFAFTSMMKMFPFFYVIFPENFRYDMITFILYLVVVLCLIFEVYQFIFGSSKGAKGTGTLASTTRSDRH